LCSNSGAMGVRRVRSNTGNEPPHETEMALWRTSDLSMGRCVCSLDDVHGPLEHEWPAASSLQELCALILGQPPRTAANQSAGGTGRCSLPFWTLMPISKPLIAETETTGAASMRCKAVADKAPP